MRLLGTALWCAVLVAALPGCYLTARAGLPMGGPDDFSGAVPSLDFLVGVNVEAANFLRVGGGLNRQQLKGPYEPTTGKGTMEMKPVSTSYELAVALKNWYRPPEHEVCDYNVGWRARAGGFFATVQQSGKDAKEPGEGLIGFGGQIEIGGFDVRPARNNKSNWFAGGAWIGAGAAMWNYDSDKYSNFTVLQPFVQATFEWMPMGLGAFFAPEGKMRGVTRVKIAEVFHCEDYYPDKNSAEYQDCQAKVAKYLKKAQRQRAVEVAENRCI